jgi:probable O-glycosylation ligase (exosortase A-associated)
MRDIIFSLFVLGMIPACFRKPFIGLVMFSWLAYMRPQDLTWGFAREQRWSYLVAIVMFAGFLRSRPDKWFIANWRSYLMLFFIVLVGVSAAMSENPNSDQLTKYLEFSKIIVIALFTTAVVTKREHLRMLLWIIALSLGFYGVKSGIWGFMTGFGSRIIRGPGGMMLDNNDLSLALSMAVPVLVHLGLTEQKKMVRRAFLIAVPLTIITIMLTQSRGGFLSVSTAIAVMIWHSRNRVAVFSVTALVGVLALSLAPSNITERLSTIKDYETEGSAAGRIHSWGVGYRMATANPLLGVGMNKYRQHFLEFDPNPSPDKLAGHNIIVAHNSYIQIWAESGTISLLIFLTLLFSSLVTIWRVRKRALKRYYTSWILNYATMFQASFAAFIVGGTFLNRAHFDLVYQFVGLVMVFAKLAFDEMDDTTRYPLREGGRAQLSTIRPRTFSRSAPGYARGFRNTPAVALGRPSARVQVN